MVDYDSYLASPEWRDKAHAAKQRAGWQCALCSSSTGLEVHHRTYRRLGSEDPSDLVVLCSHCHRTHHRTLETVRKRAEQHQQLLPFVAYLPHGEELN
jgi:5-methylcytosine-specific restriction endonuclease McrA